VSLDGSGLTRLTAEAGSHSISLSPNGKLFTDSMIRNYGLSEGGGLGWMFYGGHGGLGPMTAAAMSTAERLLREAGCFADVSILDCRRPSQDWSVCDSEMASVMRGEPQDTSCLAAFGIKTLDDVDLHGTRGWVVFLPVLPLRADAMERAFELAHEVVAPHGFEPRITMNFLGRSAVESLIAVVFERSDAEASARAQAALHSLHAAFRGSGFALYRSDVDHQAGALLYGDEPHGHVLRALKASLDPRGLIAPGRYGLGEDS